MRTFHPANRVLCLICASRQSSAIIRTSGPQQQQQQQQQQRRRQERRYLGNSTASPSQFESTSAASTSGPSEPPPPPPPPPPTSPTNSQQQRPKQPYRPNGGGDGSKVVGTSGGTMADGPATPPTINPSPSISNANTTSHNNTKSRRKENVGSTSIDADSSSSRTSAPPPPPPKLHNPQNIPSTNPPQPPKIPIRQNGAQVKSAAEKPEKLNLNGKPLSNGPTSPEQKKSESGAQDPPTRTPNIYFAARPKREFSSKKRRREAAEAEAAKAAAEAAAQAANPTIGLKPEKHNPSLVTEAKQVSTVPTKKAKAPAKPTEPKPSKIVFRFEIKPAAPGKSNQDESTEIKLHATGIPKPPQPPKHATPTKATHIPTDDVTASRPPLPSEGIGTKETPPPHKKKEPLELPALDLLEMSRIINEAKANRPAQTWIRVRVWDTVPKRPTPTGVDGVIAGAHAQKAELPTTEIHEVTKATLNGPKLTAEEERLMADVQSALEKERQEKQQTQETTQVEAKEQIPEQEASRTTESNATAAPLEEPKMPATIKQKVVTEGLFRTQRVYNVPEFPSFDALPQKWTDIWPSRPMRKKTLTSTPTPPSPENGADNLDTLTKMVKGEKLPQPRPEKQPEPPTAETQAPQQVVEEAKVDYSIFDKQIPIETLTNGIPVSDILSQLPAGPWSRKVQKGKAPNLDFKGRVVNREARDYGPETRLVKAIHKKHLNKALKELFSEKFLEAPMRNMEERHLIARDLRKLMQEPDQKVSASTFAQAVLRLADYGGVTHHHYWEAIRRVVAETDNPEVLEELVMSGIKLVPGFFLEEDVASANDGSGRRVEAEKKPDGADLLLGLDRELGLEPKPGTEEAEDPPEPVEFSGPEEKLKSTINIDPKMLIPSAGRDTLHKENFWVLLIATFARLRHRQYSTPRMEEFEAFLGRLPTWPSNDSFKWVISRFNIPKEERFEWYDRIVWFSKAMLVRGYGLHRRMKILIKNRHAGPIEDLYLFFTSQEEIKKNMIDEHYALFISAFFTCREPIRAFEVLNDCVNAIGVPGQKAWTMMLLGCTRGQDMLSMHEVWTKMWSLGIVPDQYCWTTRIHGYFLAGQPQNGMAVLKEMEAYGQAAGVGVVNAIVDGLLRHHYYNEALKIFEKSLESGIEPNLYSYNTLLRGIVCEGRVADSPAILEQMKARNIYPDVISFSIILSGLASTRNSAFSISFLKPYLLGMRTAGVAANAQTYTALLLSLLRRDDITAAKSVLDLMSANGIRKNAYTYTILIQYFARLGRLDAMEECWRTLKSERVHPDIITYQLTVEAFATTIRKTADKPPWEAKRMMYWLQEMIRVPINPRMGTFVAVLKRLIAEGLYDDAKALVTLAMEMRGRSVVERREGWVAGSFAHYEFWDTAVKMGWAPRLEGVEGREGGSVV